MQSAPTPPGTSSCQLHGPMWWVPGGADVSAGGAVWLLLMLRKPVNPQKPQTRKHSLGMKV